MTHARKRHGGRRAVFVVAIAALISVLLPSTSADAYSGGGAAGYAETWWNSYNPNYYKFTGDDCTNYVSQALHQGGGYSYVGGTLVADNTQWWMHWSSLYGKFSWSHSFTVADDLYHFEMNHYPGGIYEGVAQGNAQLNATYTPNSMVTGDVLFYDWDSNQHLDHASIQVGIGNDPGANNRYGNYVDQHSTNRKHAFWSLIPYNSQWPTTTVYFVHISASNG